MVNNVLYLFDYIKRKKSILNNIIESDYIGNFPCTEKLFHNLKKKIYEERKNNLNKNQILLHRKKC